MRMRHCTAFRPGTICVWAFMGWGWNGNSWALCLCKGYCTSVQQKPTLCNGAPLEQVQTLNICRVRKPMLKVERWKLCLNSPVRRRSHAWHNPLRFIYSLFLFGTKSVPFLRHVLLSYGGKGKGVTKVALLWRVIPSLIRHVYHRTCVLCYMIVQMQVWPIIGVCEVYPRSCLSEARVCGVHCLSTAAMFVNCHFRLSL